MDRRIRFEYATCERGNFLIRREKVADSKISGYVWTGPQLHGSQYGEYEYGLFTSVFLVFKDVRATIFQHWFLFFFFLRL